MCSFFSILPSKRFIKKCYHAPRIYSFVCMLYAPDIYCACIMMYMDDDDINAVHTNMYFDFTNNERLQAHSSFESIMI